jgi:RimJ/RimL family protein N-acetyltransferase
MITLLPSTASDFPTLISWVDSAEALMQFAGPGFQYPLTHEQLSANNADRHKHNYKVADAATGNMIGYGEIHLDGSIARLCRILVGDPSMRGKGIGLQIILRLLDISFTELRADKAELNVYDWNTGAIKCYEKAGFRINPEKIRMQEINGQVWKTLNMITDRESWLKKRETATQ